MKKLNCWEFNDCGREPDGLMTPICGECKVPQAMKYDGINGGVAAGRACWMVLNSICRLERKSQNRVSCHDCAFYKRVIFEEENVSFKFSSVKP